MLLLGRKCENTNVVYLSVTGPCRSFGTGGADISFVGGICRVGRILYYPPLVCQKHAERRTAGRHQLLGLNILFDSHLYQRSIYLIALFDSPADAVQFAELLERILHRIEQ